MAEQTICCESCLYAEHAQALIEGSFLIPAGEEAQSVIDVIPMIEPASASAREGGADVSGTARFTVIYEDRAGECRAFEAQCGFEHFIEIPGAQAEMTVLCEAEPGAVSHSLNGNEVSIRLGVRFAAALLCGRETQLAADIPGAELLVCEETLSVLIAARRVKSYISTELRLPQSMPPCREPLFCRAAPVIERTLCEDGRIIIEGSMSVCAVYVAADKSIKHFEQTVPFGEIIKEEGAHEGAEIAATVRCERAGLVRRDADALELSVVAGICLTVRERRPVRIIADAYAVDAVCRTESEKLCITRERPLGSFKKTVRPEIVLPDSGPEAARMLYASAYPLAAEADICAGRATVRCGAEIALCFACEQGIRTYHTRTDIELEAPAPELREGERVYARVSAEYAEAEGSGREPDLRLGLHIELTARSEQVINAIARAELSACEPLPPRIIVYFADGRRTLFEMAKHFRVRTEELKEMNPELSEGVVPKGRKVIMRRG